MVRVAHRWCSLLVLLSMVVGWVPGATAVASTTPTSSANATPALAQPTAPLPALGLGVATSTSILTIDQLRAQYGSKHTLNGVFDGSFSTPRSQTHLFSGPVTLQGEGSLYYTFTVPAVDKDSVEVDLSVTAFRIYGASASIAVRPVGSTTWSTATTVLAAPGTTYGGPPVTAQTTGKHVSLGQSVPRASAMEVRLGCGGHSGKRVECTWSNLRFYRDMPGWSLAPNSLNNPSTWWTAGVRDSSFSGIAPQDGAFLALNVAEAGSGARFTSSVTYRGPLLQLPTFSSTVPMTTSLRWARQITDDTPWNSTAGAYLRFTPLDGSRSENLVDLPAGDTTTSTPWTSASSATFPTSISGKLGWIEIVKRLGGTDHVLAIDSIQFFLNGKPIGIPADQVVGKCFCDVNGAIQVIFGDPVNTASGAYYLQATDLAVSSIGPPLAFGRTYVSMFADTTKFPTTTLGPGWSHSFADALTLPNDPGGEANTVIYEVSTGNRLRFYKASDDTFSPAPGVRATLEKASDGTYTLTSRSQRVLRFDAEGRLIEQRNSAGHSQTLSYYNAPATIQDGQLEQITDTATGRSLTLTYVSVGGQARIASVRDGASREVSYTYTTNGDLETVTDLRDGVTTYAYDGTTHLLTSIDDPAGVRQITNTYDTNRRVSHQVDATGLETSYSYATTTAGQTTTITQQRSGMAADVRVDHYRPDGSIEYQEHNGTITSYTTFDGSFAPSVQVDGNGNALQLQNTGTGLPTSVTDALSQTTSIAYNAQQRPTELRGTDQVTTTVAYDANGNVTQASAAANGLQLTTVYTYTADNRLQEQRSPDGIVSRYDYDTLGQVISTTVGYGTTNAQVTTFEYDQIGRLVATTVGAGTSLSRRDVSEYNDDNTVARTIQNYQNGIFDAATPDEDLITSYGYDVLGRQIWVRDALGHYTATHYDSAGRVAWTARNLQPLQLDSRGQPTYHAFDPAQPDRNAALLYGYDGLGRTTLVTETGILTGTFDTATRTFSDATTRVTRTEYDDLSRPVTTTLNYRADITIGTLPDVNIQTVTQYDAAGNVTGQRDPLGRWTRTEYDVLNRPVKTIRNYEDGDPLTIDEDNVSWATLNDTDLITAYQYRADGQLSRLIDNYVDGTFTATEPITDRVTLSDYDALGRGITTTLVYDPTTVSSRTDTNRVSVTRYDATTGRVLGQQDALGRWTHHAYDALGRVTTTMRNCRDANGTAVAQNCAAFSVSVTDRNIPTTTRYDALGRAFEAVDALGHVTRTTFDELSRVVATIQNYQNGTFDASHTDEDVTTGTTYDALGRAVSTVDPTGATTTYGFNGLGQTVVVTDSVGRVSRMGYDGSGAQRWTMTPDGRFMVLQVDGLGRVTTTIQNYEDGLVAAAEPTDRDLQATTVYDRAGRRVQTIDAAGRVTAFGYDLQDRLVWVQENQQTGTCTHAPCNVLTQYQYDRVGNRTAIVDANGHTRRFSYDAADQQVTATDALGNVTSWEYDRGGRRTRHHSPRGSTWQRSYSYDDLDRLTQVVPGGQAPELRYYDALGRQTRLLGHHDDVTFAYDALGRITEADGSTSGQVQYAYTARGQRAQIIYPSGTDVRYTYAADGQLAQVAVANATTPTATYQYDAAGRLRTTTLVNGAVTTLTYDGSSACATDTR